MSTGNPLQQSKLVAAGKVRSWTLDLAEMAHCANWAQRARSLLEDEVERVLHAFPSFLAVVGKPLSCVQCCVEAAEPLLCPDCEELVVFDRGTRCATCERPVYAPAGAVVGFVGRIPALISGRPFAAALEVRLAQLQQEDRKQHTLFARALLDVEGKKYLAPRFGLWFSRDWPHSDPPVMVWGEYFEMLNIPTEHVFPADRYYRLCLYARWLEQPACLVLQNRVIPRLLIDLMIADLHALGRLGETLGRLNTDLYELYNTVGHTQAGEPFRRVYRELVGLDVEPR